MRKLLTVLVVLSFLSIILSGCSGAPVTVSVPPITVTNTVTSTVVSAPQTITVTPPTVTISQTVTVTPTPIISTTPLPTPTPTPTQSVSAPIVLTDVQLLQAYNQNKLTAEANYKGKLLQITGTVSSVGSNPVPYVSLQANVGAYNVRCFFQNQNLSSLSSLGKGDAINVKGIWDDYGFGSLDMNNCVLLSSTPNPSPAATKTIIISYSSTTATQLGTGGLVDQAKSGYTYLIVTMTIENKGYDSFSINPLYFSVIVSNVKTGPELMMFNLQNQLGVADILNGGKLSGALAFQVPLGTTDFSLQYNSFQSYNVTWVKQ